MPDMQQARIKKVDEDLQVVYGEVYAPNVPDAQGEFMTPTEVRKMAHRYMEKMELSSIDTQHDNVLNGSQVVESFIADEDSTLYIPESWVVGIHVPDKDTWDKVRKGELNGFSMEGLVYREQREVFVEIPDEIEGTTIKDDTGHVHKYVVKYDDDGVFLGGRTNVVEDHWHEITRGSVVGKSKNHVHKYSMMDSITIDYEE